MRLTSAATMTAPAPTPLRNPAGWLSNQPYLLLTLTSLFWAGNIVLARHVGNRVPPITLTTIRWFGVFLILLPFAWPHLGRDWPALRARLPLMLFLSLIGFAYNNAISYWAMQYTEALNALLIQSSGPLFVALWSLVLFGVRLTGAQFAGIAISLAGVLTIVLRGDLTALAGITFNKGDVMFASSLVSFGLYSALIPRRPKTHQLSFISFTTCCGALMLVPFSAWEFALLPSGAGIRFGDGHPAARRTAATVSSHRLCAGTGRRRDRLSDGIGPRVKSLRMQHIGRASVSAFDRLVSRQSRNRAFRRRLIQ